MVLGRLFWVLSGCIHLAAIHLYCLELRVSVNRLWGANTARARSGGFEGRLRGSVVPGYRLPVEGVQPGKLASGQGP